VERNNITIDGNSFTLQGSGAYAGEGIYLYGRNNVTIKSMIITSFSFGIRLGNSSGNSISVNVVENNNEGIELSDSSDNSVNGNYMTNNEYGIYLYSSSNNSVTINTISASKYYGISLYQGSSGNNIYHNILFGDGLRTYNSYSNIVEDNLVNGEPLVYFEGASDLVIEKAGQVILVNCDNITVRNLNLSFTDIAVQLWQSNNSTITSNNIANNTNGIWLYNSSGNKFYHNNFINNTNQVSSGNSVNLWDDGYPSGGNYWSDYNGTDADHDGIGDTAYTIDANNTDNYPLMTQYIIPEFPSFLIPLLFMVATLLAVTIYRRKYSKQFHA
jgi:parallel beta-helix repeat protein